jgi:hypothetical protein
MRRSARISVLAAACAGLSSVLLTAPAAAAPGSPLYGDVNGDGRVDQVVLGSSAAGCTTTVRLGLAGGGYGVPVTRPYTLSEEDYMYCPDLGVVVDLGGDGQVELVLTFFDGTNGGPGLLVLRDWTPSGGFEGQFQPSGIGTADFNGDGLMDVWQRTDQGEGFSTYLNTNDGRLVPGPLGFSSSGLFRVELTDFDGDGGTDVLAYDGDFQDEYTDVLVGFGDGRVVELHNLGDFDAYADASIVDGNGDALPDVRVLEPNGLDQVHLSNGDGTFRLASWGSPAVTVGGVVIGSSYGDSATLTATASGPGALTATLDGQLVALGASLPLYALPLGEHTLVITATEGAEVRTRTVLFDTTTSYADVRALLARFRTEGRVTAATTASLLDRLDRAQAKAVAGSESPAIAYLEQLVAKARNQVKGDALDLQARDVLVRDAQALIADLRAQDEAER